MTAPRPGWRQDGWGFPKPRRTYRNPAGQAWRVDQPVVNHVDQRKPGEAFCSDFPDREGCMQGLPCDMVKRVNGSTDFDRHVWSALTPLGFNPTPLHGSKR